MNVLHVITRMILGGAQENTLLTCQGLARRGHKVTLITGPALGPEGELLSEAQRSGFQTIVLEAMRREIHPLRDWRAYRELRHLIEQLRPEIVHTHSSKAGILGRQAAAGARRRAAGCANMKTVHTIHGLPFHRYARAGANMLYVLLERRAARQTDALISVADAMTEQALVAGVGQVEQYTTIYSGMVVEHFLRRPAGVDEFRRGLGLGEADVLVTQVSRLAELKGHEYILAAAERVADPRVHFCFVGDGRRRAWIEREVLSRGLSGRVHLTGLLPPAEIPKVLYASDMLVHCSLREGLARALPQAMLAGRPVISFDVDGAREVVCAETGVLLEPCDAAGLTTAIQTLAGSAELRARLGEAGRKLASRRFDHEHMVDRIEGVYRRISRS